jgi:transposase
MEREELFEIALDIRDPLYIEKIDFSKDNGELNIYINFKKGSKFKCPRCGEEGKSAYDTEQKTWRHLNFFQYKSFIHFRTPRVDCENDGILMIIPPWAGKNGFTLLMDLMIMELAKVMPVKNVAEMLDEHDTKIWRVIKNYVNTAQAIRDFSEVKNVGIDETSSKKGHNYITTFVDMDKSAVIYATEGKSSNTISEFKEELPYHYGNPEEINNFSIDMSPAFKKGLNENFPWAAVTFDKFHVIKLINEAIDKTRRDEQKNDIELKYTRFLWLKNQNKLNEEQLNKIDTLSKQNKKTARAYQMKLVLQDIYNTSTDKTEASIKLNKLYQWAVRSRLEHIKVFAKTLKSNWQGLVNYFDSRLTNGVLEGINGLIQTAKRKARGFKNVSNFITIIYLIAGKLTFNFNQIGKMEY